MCGTSKMFARACFWFLLAVTHSLAAQENYMQRCILRNRQIGECRLLHDCPEIESDPKNAKKPLRCGVVDVGDEPIVCCPKSVSSSADPGAKSEQYRETDDDYIFFNNAEDEDVRRTLNNVEDEGTRWIPSRPPTSPETTTIRGERKASTMCQKYASGKTLRFGPQILDGKKVNQGDFPHLAALGWDGAGTELQFRCGGSLISDRFVLTAAHCLRGVGGSPSLVRLGTVDLQQRNLDYVTDYAIEKEFVHDRFDRNRKTDDIALLRLAVNVTFNLNIYPACLYMKEDNPQALMTISGWGSIRKNGPTSDVLLKAEVSAVPTSSCFRSYSTRLIRDQYPNGFLPEQLCAQDLNRTSDTCPGDSGGPLQLPLESSDLFYVVGITSFGKGNCVVLVPGVYTRVASYLDWIESIVWP